MKQEDIEANQEDVQVVKSEHQGSMFEEPTSPAKLRFNIYPHEQSIMTDEEGKDSINETLANVSRKASPSHKNRVIYRKMANEGNKDLKMTIEVAEQDYDLLSSERKSKKSS